MGHYLASGAITQPWPAYLAKHGCMTSYPSNLAVLYHPKLIPFRKLIQHSTHSYGKTMKNLTFWCTPECTPLTPVLDVSPLWHGHCVSLNLLKLNGLHKILYHIQCNDHAKHMAMGQNPWHPLVFPYQNRKLLSDMFSLLECASTVSMCFHSFPRRCNLTWNPTPSFENPMNISFAALM